MRLSKRSMLLITCLLTAMTLTVASTVAYLTDTARVTNTFTVGKVQIELDESVVDSEGTAIVDPSTNLPQRTNTGNNYHLIPGKTYTKDPITTVKAGSEASYVRMKVTITKYSELQTAFAAHSKTFTPGEWVEGFDNTKWNAVAPVTDTNGNLVLEYRYFQTVDTSAEPQADKALEALFTEFAVPGFLNGDDMLTLENMEIQVRSEAIQAAGFNNADEAWLAFDEAVPLAAAQAIPPTSEVQIEEGN